MTGIALMIRGPGHNFGGAWEFVVAVLLIIVVIFFRVYGPRKRSGPRLSHHTSRKTVRRSGAPVRAARSAITPRLASATFELLAAPPSRAVAGGPVTIRLPR